MPVGVRPEAPTLAVSVNVLPAAGEVGVADSVKVFNASLRVRMTCELASARGWMPTLLPLMVT